VSVKDQPLFPPRCCRKEIDPEDVAHLLIAKIIEDFEEKKIENNTKDKTYCSEPTCSLFLKEEQLEPVRQVAVCPICAQKTCILCKAAQHGELLCDEDGMTVELEELAEKNNWKRCPSCHSMIEIAFGCNHMR
jgi:hypothetical protein